jgi:hypothetical protein
MKGGEISPVAQTDEHSGAEMASSSFTGLLNRNHREPNASSSNYTGTRAAARMRRGHGRAHASRRVRSRRCASRRRAALSAVLLLRPRAAVRADVDRKGSARKKGDYATVAIQQQHDDGLGDDFYDEQLRSDGWHLDEVRASMDVCARASRRLYAC